MFLRRRPTNSCTRREKQDWGRGVIQRELIRQCEGGMRAKRTQTGSSWPGCKIHLLRLSFRYSLPFPPRQHAPLSCTRHPWLFFPVHPPIFPRKTRSCPPPHPPHPTSHSRIVKHVCSSCVSCVVRWQNLGCCHVSLSERYRIQPTSTF